ncbi:MAG: hypothetical protein IKT27_05970 [Clostridia bacterium]|nr:hypothetical protein [Clostridia bacterium]
MLTSPMFLIAVTSVSLLALVGGVLWALHYKRKRDRIKNYTCAEAQLVTKNAEKAMHKKAREHANKLLYKVLTLIDQAAHDERKYEMVIDTSDFITNYAKYGDAKKYRNAIKDALRSRGFRIIPDFHHKEEIIHISWQTSHGDTHNG